MTPIDNKVKGGPKEADRAPEVKMENFNELMSPDQNNFDSPLLYKYASRWNTVKRNNKKLIESESSVDDNQKKQMLVRRISEMKSKLPPSHCPENVKNELTKQDSLVDKLQAMHVTEISEELKEMPNEEPEVNPKFLPIEMTGDSLEELARIDAELAREDSTESKNDESTVFVRRPYYICRSMKTLTCHRLKKDLNTLLSLTSTKPSSILMKMDII